MNARELAEDYDRQITKLKTEVARLAAERDDYRAKWRALSAQAGGDLGELMNAEARADRLETLLTDARDLAYMILYRASDSHLWLLSKHIARANEIANKIDAALAEAAAGKAAK